MTKWIIIGGVVVALAAGGVLYNSLKSSKRKTLSLQELIEHYSASTDKIIIDELAKGSLTYVSGQTSIQIMEKEQAIHVISEYYFQTDQGEWVKKTNKDMANLQTMTDDAIEELRKRGGMILFEIEAPNQASASTAV